MPPEKTRADSLREYLTGASSAGGVQTDPNLCFGHHRSSTEAVSLGISIANAIPGLMVQYAAGANPPGAGILTAVDATHLTWQPYGYTLPGPACELSGGGVTCIVEALDRPDQYLRVNGSSPLSIQASTITLSVLANDAFGFEDVVATNALAGISEYRATILKNESGGLVSAFVRYVATYAGPTTSDNGQLGASGAGTIGTTSSFSAWPPAGWCQVRTAGGSLRELVYYTSRTDTVLTVPAAGRSLLGTSAAAGLASDLLYSVAGVAIGADPAGVQAAGSSVQTIANATTAPTGVTWNNEITAAGGVLINNILPGYEVAVWMWRQLPPGTVSTPAYLVKFLDNFNAY